MNNSIIANGVVYVKYKTLFKTKLMVLNCCLFLLHPSMLAMMHVYGVAGGGYMLSASVCESLTTYIKPRYA